MLTIKAPIELTCTRPIASPQDGFCERIQGNYQWMAVQVSEEELLHLVTTPPEVYLEESGMTSIVQNTRIENRQEQKLEMINNLLNRISLTEQVSLTYQDRVYITDVLHKLGIRDARQFMKRVQMQKQETKHAEELTSLYWNHLEELSITVQQFQSQTQKNYREQQNFLQQEKRELYEQILNRLQTGAIYQILSNFTSNYPGNSTYVSSQELQITEQKRMASSILLNQMKEVTVGKPVPFVFRHENYYEKEGDEYLTQEETAGNQITEAVLFQLADQLYFNRFEKNLQKHENWIHMEQAMYQSAENTFERMRLELTERYENQEVQAEQTEPQGQIYEREIRQIREILRTSERAVESSERISTLEREQQVLERHLETGYPQAELYYPESELIEETERTKEAGQNSAGEMEPETSGKAQKERVLKELHREYERERENQSRLFEHVEQYLERVVPERQNRQEAENTEKLIYRREQEAAAAEKDAAGRLAEEARTIQAAEKPGETQTMLQIQRELDHWSENRKQQETRESSTTNVENRILTRELADRILYTKAPEPEGLAGELPEIMRRSEEPADLHLENRIEPNQIIQHQEEQTELLAQELRQINQKNIENYQRYQQILKNQQQFQKTEIKNPIEQTRMESLEALKHPEQVMEQYREKEVREETRRTERVKQLMQLLPEDVRRVYEQIESAGAKGYGAMEQTETRTARNVGHLIQDIHRIETENRVKRQEAVEQIQRVREHSGELLERLEERPIPEQSVRKSEQVTHSQLSLVHKSAENQVNEEFLQQVMEQNRLQAQKTVKEENVQERRESTKRTIYQQDQTKILKETQDLQELIRKGVQSQVGSISEQVYSNLEKRLLREKKRRGF